MLHGLPTSSYLWRNVQRQLERAGRPTIAFDLLGTGRSRRGARGRTRFMSQAKALLEALDVLGVDRFALAAHDVGGGVAHHMLMLEPERAVARVFMNAVGLASSWPVPLVALMRQPMWGEAMSVAPSGPLLVRELRRGVHHPGRITGEVARAYTAPWRGWSGRLDLLDFVKGFEPGATEFAMREHARHAMPTLFLWGIEDVFQPLSVGKQMAAVFGELPVEIAQAGHFLQEDQPRRIGHEIESFLGGASRAEETA
jgi:pimeloyl-ACP methyl ester carboxylesterase